MFGGIFTKVLAGALLGSLLLSGWLYVSKAWQKRSYEKQIVELQEAAIKAQVQIAKQEAEIADLQAVKKRHEVKERENKEIDQVVNSGDDARMRQLFRDMGMLPPKSDGAAKPGAGSSPGH